jgi:rubrerythrin
MLSKIPVDLEKIAPETLDKEILRAGIIAELDAINLYEQMAALTANRNTRKILLAIAREEKTHVGEFQTLLLKEDKELEKELEVSLPPRFSLNSALPRMPAKAFRPFSKSAGPFGRGSEAVAGKKFRQVI